jgi:hypothetical protein
MYRRARSLAISLRSLVETSSGRPMKHPVERRQMAAAALNPFAVCRLWREGCRLGVEQPLAGKIARERNRDVSSHGGVSRFGF